MITTEQQKRLNELKESYEKLQSIVLDTDPLVKIVEEALHSKNINKLKRQSDRAEAIAEAMVHFDYLESKIKETFHRYKISVKKDYNKLSIELTDLHLVTYNISALYEHGHAPFSGFEYNLDWPKSIRVYKNEIDYHAILGQVAKWIAKNIQPTV